MLLQTSIPARADGTVVYHAKDGQNIVFKADSEGNLTADVTDDADLLILLNGGLFFPSNPEDFDAAVLITGKRIGVVAGDDELDLENDDDPVNPTALPVEANTPPVVKPVKKAAPPIRRKKH